MDTDRLAVQSGNSQNGTAFLRVAAQVSTDRLSAKT